MDLNAMLIFARVAENKSFTKAAKELGVEKSTVSSKIIDLENRLGTRLLNRNTRSVALTEAGEGYYRYCLQIVENAMEADDYVKTFNSEPQGVLRVCGPTGIGKILLKDVLGSFLCKYPKVLADVWLDNKPVELIRERYDVSLRVSNCEIKEPGLTTRHITNIQPAFYATATYLANHGTPENPKDLEKHCVIHSFALPHPDFTLRKGKRRYTPAFRSRVTINSVEACIEATSRDLGIAILPTSAVREDFAGGKLIRVLLDYKLSPTSLYAVYPDRQWIPSKLKVFLEFLDQWGQAYREL